MTGIILTTERLTLMPPTPADLDDMAAMAAEPRVYMTLTGTPEPREQVWNRILRYVGHWAALGYGHWCARDTASGRFVGSFGLMDSRRATRPSYEGTPEAGWVAAGWAAGQGFAGEALQAMLGWADERFERTVCIIDPDNAPSLKLAAKLGYRVRQDAIYLDRRVLILDRTVVRPAGERPEGREPLLTRLPPH